MRIRERASVGQGDRGCGVPSETQINAPGVGHRAEMESVI